MQQLLLVLVLISAAANYVLYKERDSLQQEIVILESNQEKLELAVKEQQESLQQMEAQAEKQADALLAMQARNQEIAEDMNRYLDIFKRHNLNQLASAKPGLIEKRFNSGTKKIFETIENDSKTLENFNN